MQILQVNEENKDEVINYVVEVLKTGGVVMHPTDTCFGLAVDIRNEDALRRLYAVKKMDTGKPVSIMVDSFDRAQEYGDFSDEALKLVNKFWPGPLTCLLKRSEILPKFLNPGFENVGIRFPDHKFTLGMLKAFSGVLTTTSANISGAGEVESIEGYIKQIENKSIAPDLLIFEDGYKVKNPSTILDFTGDFPNVIREGDEIALIKEYMPECFN